MTTDFYNIGNKSRRQFLGSLGLGAAAVTFGSIAKKAVAQSNPRYYYLKHLFSGKYMCSGETENGGKLWLWGPIPNGHEVRYKFQFIKTGDRYHYIKLVFSWNYLLSGQTVNGSQLWL